MIEIKDLLARFDHILLKGEAESSSIREIIKEVVGLEIKPEDIKIKNNIIYLNIKPIYKSEILLKQEKIIDKMQEVFGKKTRESIR